ncbi:hypothetical protein BC937DRAFT_94907 [Endogone sp. FLAS-F59071]|nr:hypothetical protein BC937DRAFT_94907 [Endogone sp. FLAS-F59071]|eukprot:RUS13697.1 hypothetical protein BC937DRAFT_94907 [Endogone sp. FLAS-F59071]
MLTPSCLFPIADPILLAVKLTKYAVGVTLAPADASSPPVVETHPFTTFVALDFLEAAKVHANYRFLIEGRGSRKIYLLVWLFNWDTKIAYNEGFRDADAEAAADGREGVTKNGHDEDSLYRLREPQRPSGGKSTRYLARRPNGRAPHLPRPDLCAARGDTASKHVVSAWGDEIVPRVPGRVLGEGLVNDDERGKG